MDRHHEIEFIVEFVDRHRESYASLAVCRRAIDQGLARVDGPTVAELARHLASAPDDEIAAYASIVH